MRLKIKFSSAGFPITETKYVISGSEKKITIKLLTNQTVYICKIIFAH